MLIGEVVETVYTSVAGGRPNTDFSVLRVDIRALLPAAINWAITQDYWANLANEGDREVPNFIITVFEDLKIETDSRCRKYVTFDKQLVNVGGNGGIRFVNDLYGNAYVPRSVGGSNNYWDKILKNKEYTLLSKKLMLYNVPELVEKVDVGVILDVSALKDDDQAPIPAGSEPQVIDMLTQFFNNQRMGPKDYVINGVDPVNAIKE